MDYAKLGKISLNCIRWRRQSGSIGKQIQSSCYNLYIGCFKSLKCACIILMLNLQAVLLNRNYRISDERTLATSDEEKEKVCQLFERAVKDYVSGKLGFADA